MPISDAPPRVTGRHRNRALAAARRRHAVERALAGATYQAIAEELGYASRGTVYRIVQQAMARAEAASIDTWRGLELDRLDRLLEAHWAAALTGDLQASAIVLKVLDRRSRLLGLYAKEGLARTERTSEGFDPVVVDPADLVACQGWPAPQAETPTQPASTATHG